MKIKMPDGSIVENKTPEWKTPWNHDTNFESDRTALYCNDPSLTKQEFKDETDINIILERFLKTQEPPPMPLPEHFMDISGRTSYFDMQCRVAEANTIFYQLDAQQRAEFQNDPSRWADAVVQAVERGDRDTLADLGIDIPPERPQEATSTTPAGEASPAPGAVPAPPAAPASGAPNAPPGGA